MTMSFRSSLRMPALFSVLALYVICGSLERARGQERDALQRRRVELTDRIHSLRQARPGYVRSDQVARLQAQLRESQARFLERRNQLNQQLREHASQPAESNAAKADELLGKIQKLQDEKKRALRDLRAGLFCSECKRTKTEIEATGEPFGTHLDRVEGYAIPASPELIAEKMAEFDAKIDRLQEELERLRQSDLEIQRGREEGATKLRRELAALDIEEREALAAIRRAIGDARAEERSAADDEEARWLDEVRAAEDALQEVEIELDRLARASNAPGSAPNEALPDQWLDEDAGVGFVRFDSDPEPSGAVGTEPGAWPEPYAGPTGEPWTPFETFEAAPTEFADAGASIRDLLADAYEGAREAAATLPELLGHDDGAAPDFGLEDALETARDAIQELQAEDMSTFERIIDDAKSFVVEAAPAFVEAVEERVYAGLTPEQRFELETRTRVWLAPIFGLLGFAEGEGHWHLFALKSIPRYVNAMDTPPEYIGVDDQ